MRIEKIREIDTEELARQANDAQEQMFRLRFQLTMGQTDTLKKLRTLRKDRARMLTTLREREINPAAAPAPKAGKKKRGK